MGSAEHTGAAGSSGMGKNITGHRINVFINSHISVQLKNYSSLNSSLSEFSFENGSLYFSETFLCLKVSLWFHSAGLIKDII